MNRNISDVIDQLLEVIPVDQTSLIKKLTELKNSANLYLIEFGGVPYLMSPQWLRGGSILYEELINKEILNTQRQKVIDIWVDDYSCTRGEK